MRRMLVGLTAFFLLCALIGCATPGSPSVSSLTQATPAGASPAEEASTPSSPSTPETGGGKADPTQSNVLVAYFSATGNTRAIAEHLQSILNADLHAIVPETPYTAEDLEYGDGHCRANLEQNDPASRPAIANELENPGLYDVVFLGYPIWWGQAPKILYTFLERYDFGGATIVPFCTSGSSGMGSSADGLQALAENARWLPGQRFSASASASDVASWVESLDLPLSSGEEERAGTQLLLTFEGGEAHIVLENNATTRDFLSILPASLLFQEYAGCEKISYLAEEVSTAGAPERYDPRVGDVALYAPWGNLAIFYGDADSASGLVPMGRVTSGLELLSSMEGEFEVQISIFE